jgi:UDP-glucose 4-epimerase
MNKVLVTGGLGYIGSHTCVALIESGYEVIIIDDLSNASIEVLSGIGRITGVLPEFHQLDLCGAQELTSFFERQPDLTHVIHFAASKAVGESVERPLHYYENNVVGLINLLKNLQGRSGVSIIFSSSCTVYGQADQMPITEQAPIKPAESPYGNTKQIGEEILRDVVNADPEVSVVALRYFNPIGAHESAEIGELPIGVPQNLVPYITQTAYGIREQLSVFGNDYPTADGTCIRDYIHVVDLAKAHVSALERLMQRNQKERFEVFNVGTGKGSSVLEVINSFERVTGQTLKYHFAERRQGDVVEAYADTTRANAELNWKAVHSLDDALRSAWMWEQKIRF